MKKEDVSKELYEKIMESFMQSLIKNGFKSTTMDGLAASLQMSKRTLYEIFGSKNELFYEANCYYQKKMTENQCEIFASSSNVMEAIIKCVCFNRDIMSKFSAEFLRDLEAFTKNENLISKDLRLQHFQHLYNILQRGIEEGYFRNDINLMVQCRMFSLQMESLKRTEELFPEDISLLEVYDAIIIGFLRSISSQKGLDELEKYMPLIKQS